MSDEPVRSVLYDVQAEQGAVFEDYDGWVWTLNLGQPGEYEALRSAASMRDVYGLVKWDVRGPDAVAAVQRVFTNAIGALKPGQVRYGGDRRRLGRARRRRTVFRHGGDHLWVMTNGTTFAEHLAAASPALTCRGEPAARDAADLGAGPAVARAAAGPDDARPVRAALLPLRDRPGRRRRHPRYVLHTGFSGELGFELIPTDARTPGAVDRARQAGVRPIGFEAVEIAPRRGG